MMGIITAGPTPDAISERIVVLRGQRVLLDADLARLYGVTTARLNEQVRRNLHRFPVDFLFRLTAQELTGLMSQIATSKNRTDPRGGTRKPPFAFTEHGALMAANVLRSRRAIEVSVFVIRAFVRLREAFSSHKEFARKLDELERKTAALALRHDEFAANTRSQFREVIDALRRLMSTPEPPRRPIGFVTPK
jgi:hypothetical protein